MRHRGFWWVAVGVVVAGSVGCGDSGGDDVTSLPGLTNLGEEGGEEGGGDGYVLDYRSGADALLDLRATASFSFTGEQPSLPSLSAAAVAQANSLVLPDSQQLVTLQLSTTDDLDVGDRLFVQLQYGRNDQGAVLDGGGTVNMSCLFSWDRADDSYVALSGDCDVRRSGGGYELVIADVGDDVTQLSGTMTFGPVPNQPTAYSPTGSCSEGQICLSLDPDEYEPELGYCLPTTNLKSEATPCSADCVQQLTIEVGSASTCVCTGVCGGVGSGGGGDPPVCDPAYGCVDF